MFYALPQTNREAGAALVLGQTSLVLGALTGIPAIIWGYLGYRAIRNSAEQQREKAVAITGIILGVCSLPLSVVYLVLLSGSAH